MGGDYSADLLFSKEDIISMFKQAFGHLTLEELLNLIGNKQG